MGISDSMWTSVSGLLAHGEKMNVVGNNIANVSTLGFKAQRMDFEDFIYQTNFSASGPTQVGLGVGINAIMGDFSQGAFEATNSSTDLAIGGSGYFQVRDQYSEEMYYTRAGNFNFDNEGYLRLPSGEILQGWVIDNSVSPTLATGAAPVQATVSTIQGTGVPTDIKLDAWHIPPRQTTKVDFSVNLTTDTAYDKTPSVTNPFFAMSTAWDGSKNNISDGSAPISSDSYAYQTPIEVYDEAGNSHTLTTYFDRISNPTVNDGGVPPTEGSLIANLPQGYEMYEYMVTMDPAEDQRTFGGVFDPTTGVLTGATSFQDTENAGILMKGVLIFNSAGDLINQTAYTYMGNTEIPVGQTITPDGVDLGASVDMDAYLAIDPAAVAPNDRETFINNIAGLDAQLKADINAALSTATAQALTLAQEAGDRAGKIAGKEAAEKAVVDNEAAIQATAAAAADVKATAAGDAAVADALVVNPALTPAEQAVIHQDAYNITYAAVLPAEQTAAYDAVYNNAYNLAYAATSAAEQSITYTQLSDSLPRSALDNLENEINSSVVGHPDSDESWQPTAVSNNGLPVFTANFSGHALANSVRQDAGTYDIPDASNYLIELDLGLKVVGNLNDPWGIGDPVDFGSGTASPSIADAINNNSITAGHPGSIEFGDLVAFKDNTTEKAQDAIVMVDGSSITNSRLQDGYSYGSLSNINFDQDGILYGIYTNGITMPLYQITMHDFVNEQGLNREGGNLFSATRESGNPQISAANQGGMGEIVSHNLEMSNVDMAREFVHMISTQRGFQANSKGITTVDEMLTVVIGMKR